MSDEKRIGVCWVAFRVSWEGERGVEAGLVDRWFLGLRLKCD